jgi:hypothetical protein
MAGDFLVPLLRTDGGAPDPVAIETWHLALGSTVAVEIPHDLFALWLFPKGGGAVLLGPAALAADRIAVPPPSPLLQQDDLYRLEETLRQARYGSAIAAPIREPDGSRDVGAMLLGAFAKGAFGPREALGLARLGTQLAPALRDLADRMASPSAALLSPGITRESLPEHLARLTCDAVDGPDLVRRTSGALYQVIPHDRLEIVITGPAPGTWTLLSGSSPERRWAGGHETPDPFGTIAGCIGEAATLLVPDLGEIGIAWSPESPTVPIHSLLGARLTVAGGTAGYVLLGSVGRDAFRPEDEDTLALAALLLAPRVLGLSSPAPFSPAPAAAAPPEEAPLPRAAAALANTVQLSEGLRRFGEELGRLLPHDGFSIHLRRNEWELVALDPGLPQPLGGQPAIGMRTFAGAAVLEESREWVSRVSDHREELFVPLVVAGRSVGALGIRTRGTLAARAAALIARQFADVLAPHLELVRRAAIRELESGARGQIATYPVGLSP